MTKKDYELVINHTRKTIKHPIMDSITKQILSDQLKRLMKEYKGLKKRR